MVIRNNNDNEPHALSMRRAAQAARSITLSNVTTGDAALVLEVWNDGLPATGLGEGTHDFRMSMDMALDWITTHQRALRPLWLARMDGKPAALLSFIGLHDRPGCHAACELSIHVRHGMRGRGLGRMLLARAIAAAPALRYDRYVAFIREDNTISQALFHSCGFDVWGCLHGVMQNAGQRHDLMVYGLVLDAG